jgi:hypothetical protein
VRLCHETQKRGSPEDRVVLGGPVHDFKVQLLLSVILAVAEANVECDSTQQVVHASWYNSMEGAVCQLEEF